MFWTRGAVLADKGDGVKTVFAREREIGREREGDGNRRRETGWCGQARSKGGRITENSEASGGKYSRFQANRVMTQFRKDR